MQVELTGAIVSYLKIKLGCSGIGKIRHLSYGCINL